MRSPAAKEFFESLSASSSQRATSQRHRSAVRSGNSSADDALSNRSDGSKGKATPLDRDSPCLANRTPPAFALARRSQSSPPYGEEEEGVGESGASSVGSSPSATFISGILSSRIKERTSREHVERLSRRARTFRVEHIMLGDVEAEARNAIRAEEQTVFRGPLMDWHARLRGLSQHPTEHPGTEGSSPGHESMGASLDAAAGGGRVGVPQLHGRGTTDDSRDHTGGSRELPRSAETDGPPYRTVEPTEQGDAAQSFAVDRSRSGGFSLASVYSSRSVSVEGPHLLSAVDHDVDPNRGESGSESGEANEGGVLSVRRVGGPRRAGESVECTDVDDITQQYSRSVSSPNDGDSGAGSPFSFAGSPLYGGGARDRGDKVREFEMAEAFALLDRRPTMAGVAACERERDPQAMPPLPNHPPPLAGSGARKTATTVSSTEQLPAPKPCFVTHAAAAPPEDRAAATDRVVGGSRHGGKRKGTRAALRVSMRTIYTGAEEGVVGGPSSACDCPPRVTRKDTAPFPTRGPVRSSEALTPDTPSAHEQKTNGGTGSSCSTAVGSHVVVRRYCRPSPNYIVVHFPYVSPWLLARRVVLAPFRLTALVLLFVVELACWVALALALHVVVVASVDVVASALSVLQWQR